MRSQRPDDQNNLLLAVILSMAVLLGWQLFYAGPQMKVQQERLAREKQVQTEVVPPSGTAPVTEPKGAAPSITPVHTPTATREEAVARSPRIAIDTPSLKGSIALKGALIDDLVLVKYRETVDPKSPNVALFSPPEAPGAYFAEYGWLNVRNAPHRLPDAESAWSAETSGPLTPAAPVTLSWDNGEGLHFRRTLTIDDNYMLTVAEEIENKSKTDVALIPYARLYRFGKPKTAGFAILHEGLIGVPGDEGLQEITYDDTLEASGSKSFRNKTGGWLGITDKYWAAALIPDQHEVYSASFDGHSPAGSQQEFFTVDYSVPPQTIAAGQRLKVEGHLYAGAKQVTIVEGYANGLGIEKFDLLIDWGWFHFFTRPLYYLLDWLNQILGNFGLAILAVTVLVKAAFFPLANKSYESMAKMKKLQPQMEVLRERFKDDKAKQQQELMALYQKEKINPLAGCLPIVIQIPVFFALYKVLFVSIDMRHAPFFGWIKDLSAADPTSLFNLFGLLPFAVPEFLHIGIWPLIMGITMWLQMQLNPPQPDPVQQQIFSWMPVLFTFLLAAFPAGLVIYWAWNNVLSIAQQAYISHKQGAEIHLVDNVMKVLAPVLSLYRKGLERWQKPRESGEVPPRAPHLDKKPLKDSDPAQASEEP
ncbi:MAG TPA: membrane protein insertase YidC [Hyphomicrobiaceae bacterium]|nr:membrane protein insertase YidC [Hyphomicrobiaceae bacterium]